MHIRNKSGRTFAGLPSLLFIGCIGLALIFTSVISHAQTQQDMNRIAAERFATADAALNKSYKQLMRTLDKPAQAKLKAAEKAWSVYRDADADFVADSERGGSIVPMVYNSRRTELTKLRTKDLQ